jgi:transcriptional regulator with XRE-family HTH domain
MVLAINLHFGVFNYMPNRIKEHRERLGWSQELLAEKAGTTYQQISRLERGERKLHTEWMGKLSSALGFPEQNGLKEQLYAGLVEKTADFPESST